METISVIPTPAGRKLQQFGAEVMPKLTYGSILLVVIYLWSITVQPPRLANNPETVAAGGKTRHNLPADTIASLKVK